MSKRPVSAENSLISPDVPNPFVHRIHLTTLDKIQVVLMSVFVAPIRLVCVAIWLVLGWALAFVSMYGRSEEEKKQPLSGWRNSVSRSMVKFLGRAYFFAWGVLRVRVTGAVPTTRHQVPILVFAPHSTFFDMIVLFFGKELHTGVSRIENYRAPIFGTLTNFTQPVYVSREDPNSRINTIKEIQERAQTKGKWPQIVIFPEGTCTNRKCLISFKPGAFIPGVPVQPVCLRYSNRMDTTTWTWDGPGAFTILWLTLCNFYTSLEVIYLPPYYPSEEEKLDAKLFANNVRKQMAIALGVPVTDHTFEDCRLMAYADKLDLPVAPTLLDLSKLVKKLRITPDTKQDSRIEKLCKVTQTQKCSAVSMAQFAEHLGLPPSPQLNEIFKLYEKDGSGVIDFRECVIALHLLARPESCDDTLRMAFQVFDQGSKGSLVQGELEEVLHKTFGMAKVNVAQVFEQVVQAEVGRITYGEFKVYADSDPELSRLLIDYEKAAELRDEERNNSLLTTLTRSKSE